MKSYYDVVAGTIFAVVSLLHLLRILLAWEVQIGPNSVPFWVSWGGMLAAGGLAVWGFASANEGERRRPQN
jgi:hypothetical protein